MESVLGVDDALGRQRHQREEPDELDADRLGPEEDEGDADHDQDVGDIEGHDAALRSGESRTQMILS